jgi:hypothetical protein
VSFTIPRSSWYGIAINSQYGMSAAWISQPWPAVTKQVVPWSAGLLLALLTMALCLVVPAPRWRAVKGLPQLQPPSVSWPLKNEGARVALHGLDRDGAPDPGVAKKMLEDVGGTWWNVYMGGPESGGSGWTPELLRQYKDHGISHFLLSYVGRQLGQVAQLTASQGERDGAEACQLAVRFGFAAAGTPVCLDLEGRTFDAAPVASLDYAGGWCHAVRTHGFRAGVYSNPRALIPLHERANRPDWVWVASWIKHTADSSADPHRATGLTADLWSAAGQRAWQYAGTFGDGACSIRGLSVDINVADSGILASYGAAATGSAQGPGRDPVPQTYIVQPGDTLSGIAAKFQIPGGWEAIFRLNRDVIGPNPDVLSPGQTLKLP